jgi:hypothetical protein
MPDAKRLLVLLLVVFFCKATSGHAEVLKSGWIPNRWTPQGQVQVIDEADGFCVNIVLHTRFMDRVVKAIIGKETANWTTNHADAATYITLISEARNDIKKMSAANDKEAMQISFRLNQHESAVVWATGEVQEDSFDHWSMLNPIIIRSFAPSRAYLRANAELILEDSLGMTREEARHLLAEVLREP